jgi:hypothetical protein
MPTLRIGLFGLRGAGKTVALSVAYLAENSEGLEVTVRDEDTIRYLRPLAEALQRGEVPPPTMVADPTRLRWSAQLAEARYELETIDFAGELLDMIGQPGDPVAEQMMKQLRTQVRDWFISCDAVILFIDSADHGTPRYRDALIRLLDEMSDRPTIRGSHQRAVVVVFTKGDQVAQSSERLSSPPEIERVLKGHPLYQVIQRRLKQRAEQIQFGVFLSSALGWQFVSIRNPSQRQVMPCNLFAALRWGLERAAQIVHDLHAKLLEELNEELGERRNGPYSWVWALAHSRSLDTMLEATDRNYQLTKGPYAATFAELRQTVRRARSFQLRGVVACSIGIFLVVLLSSWLLFRKDQATVYDTYDQLVTGDSDKGVTQRLSYYRTKIEPREWDWFWLLRDRRKSADAQAMKDSEWEALSRLPTNNANQCETRCQVLQEYVGRPDALCRQDAKELIAVTDRRWYDLVKDLPEDSAEACERKCAALQRYLDRPHALCGQDAQNLLSATKTEWDRREYADLCTPTVLTYFATVAEGYLREGRHTVLMRAAVDDLLRRIREIKNTAPLADDVPLDFSAHLPPFKAP